MQNNLFSKSEQLVLQDELRKLIEKREINADFDDEYKKVKLKTELLFYLIPQKCFFMDKEYCADFYLHMLSHVDTIINNYNITLNVPYVAYLIQVCKLRSLSFMQRLKEKENREKLYLTSSVTKEDILEVFDEEAIYRKCSSNAEPEMNLKLLFESIVVAPPGKAECELSIYLQDKSNRERFLFYLLNTASSLTNDDIEYLAAILNVSTNLLAQLQKLIFTLNEKTLSRVDEKYNQKINRNWYRYMIISSTLKIEDLDEIKRYELKRQCEYILRRIRKAQHEKLRVQYGLSIKMIASLLGCSTSTVSRGIKDVSSFIGECKNKTTLFNTLENNIEK